MTIRKYTEAFVAWCADASPAAKFERTVAQGVIGVLMSWLSSLAGAPEVVQTIVVPVTMAVLAPIQAEIGTIPPKENREALANMPSGTATDPELPNQEPVPEIDGVE